MDKENLTVLDIVECMRKFVDAETLKIAYDKTDKNVFDFKSFNEAESILKMIGVDISFRTSNEEFLDGSIGRKEVVFRAQNLFLGGEIIADITIAQDKNGEFFASPGDLILTSEKKNMLGVLLHDYYNMQKRGLTDKVLSFDIKNFGSVNLSQKGIDLYKYYSGYEGELMPSLHMPKKDGTYCESFEGFNGKTYKLLTRHDPTLIKITEIFGHEVFEPYFAGDFDFEITGVPKSGYYLYSTFFRDQEGSEHILTEKDFIPCVNGCNKALLFENVEYNIPLSKKGLSLYKQYFGYAEKICPVLWSNDYKYIGEREGKVIDRNDPALIKVVEKLGVRAFDTSHVYDDFKIPSGNSRQLQLPR